MRFKGNTQSKLACACHCQTGKLRQENHWLEANLGYVARFYLNPQKAPKEKKKRREKQKERERRTGGKEEEKRERQREDEGRRERRDSWSKGTGDAR